MTPEQQANYVLFGRQHEEPPRHDGPYVHPETDEQITYSALVKRYRYEGKRLYLAAPFADRPKMEVIANCLTNLGYQVVARWVYGGENGLTREDIAKLDLEDVDAADAVLSFTFPRGTLSSGGGRHVEFGYGLARGKRMIVIGHRENVFHHFPGVEVYPTLDAWLAGAAAVPADLETV